MTKNLNYTYNICETLNNTYIICLQCLIPKIHMQLRKHEYKTVGPLALACCTLITSLDTK